jgi:anhydro-N-acetylmuramic acid kinase
VCRLDVALGELFGNAARRGNIELCDGAADLVCCPGQTVFHWVEDGTARGSLQLGRSTTIAERSGLPVIFDLYNRDISCGGQGAPLTAMFDRLVLAGTSGSRATLNIGGIANLGVITADDQQFCYDTGPGNALIDLAVTHFCRGDDSFDRDGLIARRGTVNQTLLATLLSEPYYSAAPPKSTGKELFHFDYLRRAVERTGSLPPEDVVATVTKLTSSVIAAECRRWGLENVVGSGGGMLNPVLVEHLGVDCSPTAIVSAETIGLPVTSVEAYLIAFLGYLSASGIEGSVPTATGGRRSSLMGSMTPGFTWPQFVQGGRPPVALRIERMPSGDN